MSHSPAEYLSHSLLRQMGRDLELDCQAAHVRLLKAAPTGAALRSVLLLERPRGSRLVIKQEPSLSREAFVELSETYAQLAQALGNAGPCRMAPLVAAYPEECSLVVEHIAGPTAYARIEASEIGLDQRSAVIERCAAWLHALHGASAKGDVAFEGGWLLRRVRQVAQSVRAGEVQIAHPKRFLGLCALIHTVVRNAQGHLTPQGLRHGDAHGRNFIFGREGLFAIDPIPRGNGPIAFDVARFMTRLAYSFGVMRPVVGTNGLAGIATEDWRAFAAGYGVPWHEDPVLVAFLCRQIFHDWVQLPADRKGRSLSQQNRLEQIVAMLQTLRLQVG